MAHHPDPELYGLLVFRGLVEALGDHEHVAIFFSFLFFFLNALCHHVRGRFFSYWIVKRMSIIWQLFLTMWFEVTKYSIFDSV